MELFELYLYDFKEIKKRKQQSLGIAFLETIFIKLY